MTNVWQGDLENSFDELQAEDFYLDLDFPDATVASDNQNTVLADSINSGIAKGLIDTDAIARLLSQQNSVVLEDSQAVAKILDRIGYSGDPPRLKLQKAVNASIQEVFLENFFSELGLAFERTSSGVFDGKADRGTDFRISDTGLELEAKMYKSIDSMEAVCKNSASDFHNADLVCCYILTGSTRWCWLYRDASGVYKRLGRLPKFITKPMPKLATCRCVAGSSNEPWELRVY
jgi:hypothetical protein